MISKKLFVTSEIVLDEECMVQGSGCMHMIIIIEIPSVLILFIKNLLNGIEITTNEGEKNALENQDIYRSNRT